MAKTKEKKEMKYLKKCINVNIRKNRILIKQGKVNPAMGEIIIKVREIQKKGS